jgi:hypothetical protein
MKLRQAIEQGIAITLERNSIITGYAAGIEIFSHAVAKLNEDLKLLISNASSIQGPSFLALVRNHELTKGLLENGFHVGWHANLMTICSYLEPSTSFIPSIAY